MPGPDVAVVQALGSVPARRRPGHPEVHHVVRNATRWTRSRPTGTIVAVESAVIVPVPEVEPVVGPFRGELDRSAAWGVPAHVTVIYPFVDPRRLGFDELRRLRAVVGSVPRFAVSFAEVRWFAGTAVWLAPDPPDGFRALIDAVRAEFPECPPYGGAFGAPVPHLTIGHDANPALLAAAGRAVGAQLPLAASISTAQLFQGADTPGGWHCVADLPLSVGDARHGSAGTVQPAWCRRR